jgi:rod shape-determining protein MreC
MNRSSIIALLILAAVVGYFLSFGPESTRNLQAGFYQMISPFLSSGSGLEKQISAMRQGLKTLEQLEAETQELRVENRSLKATNQALRDVETEVNRLRAALDYRERSLFKLVPAEVVTRETSTWWRTVTINRGSRDGIRGDMAVVTEEGLVGKTTTVSDSIAVVLLVSDENCRVAAKIEGSREQGIVSGERVAGTQTPFLELNFLSKQANLSPGAKVYTSGVGGVFPSGLLVGGVVEYKVRELDGQARLSTAVDLTKLQDVFVITGTKTTP